MSPFAVYAIQEFQLANEMRLWSENFSAMRSSSSASSIASPPPPYADVGPGSGSVRPVIPAEVEGLLHLAENLVLEAERGVVVAQIQVAPFIQHECVAGILRI